MCSDGLKPNIGGNCDVEPWFVRLKKEWIYTKEYHSKKAEPAHLISIF